MRPVEEQVQSVLELEKGKGCRDRAVLGGLDRYLKRLVERGDLSAADPFLRRVAALPASGYASLSTAQRRRWIDGALGAVARTGAGKAPAAAGPKGRAATGPGRRSRREGSEPHASRDGARRSVETAAASPASASGLDAPISALKGASRSIPAKFARLGARTVRDLLYFFPRRYNDFAQRRRIAELVVGEEQTAIVNVWSAEATRIGRRLRGTEAWVADDTGMMRVVWFNQPYLARHLRTNMRMLLAGRVTLFKGQKTFESPEWEIAEDEDQSIHTGRLVPVYALTSGLAARTARRIVREALDAYGQALTEHLPEPLRARRNLMPLPAAIRQMHYPDSWSEMEEARRRLAFDELLVIQLDVLRRRQQWREGGRARPLELPAATLDGFLASLPFTLTGAQARAVERILADLAEERPMSRLLQGDVGSGKTVVAAAALVAAVANGRQGVLMAPTEILAEQHFRTLQRLFAGGDSEWMGHAEPSYLGRPLRLALLTGSLSARDKAQTKNQAAEGALDVVVGTHALIQEAAAFDRLGLAIVDEQHRFGVMQRAALREKGDSPHLLVMTATPIPRTLALTLYGDLDISLIDEMPPGRRPVKTLWALPDEREEAYGFVRDQVAQGRQVFVICPLIEESEALQVRAATQEYERLSGEVFPTLRLGLLHGRLPAAEKDGVMRAFRDRELDILVSTAVVEVGIDVPNATVMMVEGAERFGLAQLHQFRGRVGRSNEQSYCLLLSDSPSQEAQERLKLMETTNDGFALAEADLHMRGPGEFFGTRQSGLPDLRVARLTDVRLIEQAREEAARLLDADPDLSRPEHAPLAAEASRWWDRVVDEAH